MNLTASAVPPGAGTPSGVITVSAGGLGCTAILPTMYCDITFNAAGTWNLIAVYSGDANFNSSTSPNYTHQVKAFTVYLPVTFGVAPANLCGAPQLTWTGGLPAGASIDALYVNPQDDSKVVYAGAATAPGVYVSRDGGASWPRVGVPAPVLSFAAHPIIRSTVFAGTFGSGIYVSGDEGASWSAINPSPAATVWSLTAIATPGASFTLFAGTSNGVYYSPSASGPWTAAAGPIAGKTVYALIQDPRSGHLFAATSGSGVFRSVDGGVTWTQTGLTGVSAFALALSPAGTLYAGLSGQGVTASSNDGDTWATLNTGLGGLSVYALAVDGFDPQKLYAGTVGGGVFASSNGGASWSAFNPSLGQSTVYALAFNPTCYGSVLAGTPNGVWHVDTRSTPR